MKPFLVTTSVITWDASDWEVYTLNEKKNRYDRDGDRGYPVETIKEHINAFPHMFDTLEEALEFQAEKIWQLKNRVFRKNADPKTFKGIICPKCSRGYIAPTSCIYYDVSGEEQTEKFKINCFCGHHIKANVKTIVTVEISYDD